jgi:hypothetical protein
MERILCESFSSLHMLYVSSTFTPVHWHYLIEILIIVVHRFIVSKRAYRGGVLAFLISAFCVLLKSELV